MFGGRIRHHRMNAVLRLAAFVVCLCWAPASAWAQEAPLTLVGKTLEGKDFDLARRTGRVVMVVLWRTDCAVCLSKMRELRANALGWKDKAFDLVLLSLDPLDTDTLAYDRTRRQVASAEGPVWSLWQGHVQMPAAWRNAHGRLPVTLIFDTRGQLAARHEGRVPAQAWDQVADLLP